MCACDEWKRNERKSNIEENINSCDQNVTDLPEEKLIEARKRERERRNTFRKIDERVRKRMKNWGDQ